jgi:hypothetical protein
MRQYKGDLACCGDFPYFETSFLMDTRIFSSHIPSKPLKAPIIIIIYKRPVPFFFTCQTKILTLKNFLYLSYYFDQAAYLQVMLSRKKRCEVTTTAHGEKSSIETKSLFTVGEKQY